MKTTLALISLLLLLAGCDQSDKSSAVVPTAVPRAPAAIELTPTPPATVEEFAPSANKESGESNVTSSSEHSSGASAPATDLDQQGAESAAKPE